MSIGSRCRRTDTSACTCLSVSEELLILCHGVDTTHEGPVKACALMLSAQTTQHRRANHTIGDGIHETDRACKVQRNRTPAKRVKMRVLDGGLELGVVDRFLDLRAFQPTGRTGEAVVQVLPLIVAVLTN